jgi:ribonuclease-3
MQTSDLLKKLKIEISDMSLLNQAFIHRSYLNESKKILVSNERLEFLGDSILSFLVSDYLFKQFPNLEEGELTNIRSSLVKTSMLANVASELKLGDYLQLSRGEEESGGRKNNSLLADTFEAVIGAVFLSNSLESVSFILKNYLFPKLDAIVQNRTYKDAKSMFQEIVQENTKISPLYKVLKEEGPDHAKTFSVGVFVENVKWGTGDGKSKQEAEQAAATLALEKWTKK